MARSKSRKQRGSSQQEMLRSCGEIGPEDGVDPKEIALKLLRERSNSKSDRKTLQLCRQIERALALGIHQLHGGARHLQETLDVESLASDASECLPELDLVSVEPTYDLNGKARSNLLLVTLQANQPLNDAQAGLFERLLVAKKGLLRSIAASAIHRRKTPDFSFRVVGLHSSTALRQDAARANVLHQYSRGFPRLRKP